jgi:Bardet-Biedl syndrome 7 protein
VKEEIIINDAYATSAITCLDTFDISGDGKNELIVGRRDGTVQIFTMSTNDEIDIGATQIYKEVK